MWHSNVLNVKQYDASDRVKIVCFGNTKGGYPLMEYPPFPILLTYV
jgi:hypothetical protein